MTEAKIGITKEQARLPQGVKAGQTHEMREMENGRMRVFNHP